jgi:hypothetical protein
LWTEGTPSQGAHITSEWWAHLVGALRVHPHKHDAHYPPQKIEELREAGATLPNATAFDWQESAGNRRLCGNLVAQCLVIGPMAPN